MTSDCHCDKCHVAENAPEKCPLAVLQNGVLSEAVKEYVQHEQTREACHAHSMMLGRGSSKWPRVEHLREYCVQAGVQKVGLATCSAFIQEAKAVKIYLAEKEISSSVVCCKIGAIQLADIAVERDIGYKYHLCNPVGQAHVLNHLGTQVNVLLGLCIPHDMIFTMHSDAPCTTLFVKENTTNHNPFHTIQTLVTPLD